MLYNVIMLYKMPYKYILHHSHSFIKNFLEKTIWLTIYDKGHFTKDYFQNYWHILEENIKKIIAKSEI